MSSLPKAAEPECHTQAVMRSLRPQRPLSSVHHIPLGPANPLTAVNLRVGGWGVAVWSGITVVITSQHNAKADGPFNGAGHGGWSEKVDRLWLALTACRFFVNDTRGRLRLKLMMILLIHHFQKEQCTHDTMLRCKEAKKKSNASFALMKVWRPSARLYH